VLLFAVDFRAAGHPGTGQTAAKPALRAKERLDAQCVSGASGTTVMLDTLQSVGLLTAMEIVGPILLAAAIVYGIYHSRRRRRGLEPRNTKGTVYAQDRE
jgi:hypothetical protein